MWTTASLLRVFAAAIVAPSDRTIDGQDPQAVAAPSS